MLDRGRERLMPELLLELLTEEIPARMQRQAATDLATLAAKRFAAAGFAGIAARSFVTPRRLALVVDDLPARRADIAEERRGPRVGSPRSAVDGFLKSAGVALAECEQRDTGKGVFYFANIRRAGRATADILPDLIAAILVDLPWPKSMRFPAAPFRWVRPLTSVLCLFDGAVVPLDLGEVPVGAETRGHRFLAPNKFVVRDFADYREKLRDARVMLDAKDRRRAIELALYERAAEAGLTVKEDRALLDEVTGLVEWPVVLIGAIDASFMDLPPEVLTTSMRAHQKYFSCLDRDGALAPKFLLVANNIAEDGGAAIVAGNERVLRARLADARFFWDQDRKATLESRLPKLAERVFYQGLGTMADKAGRIADLAERIGRLVAAGPVASPSAAESIPKFARRAGRLCKADLVTHMVGEFPELQGVMGSYYAQHDSEPLSVAQAIAEHYSPAGPDDQCPDAEISVGVALADKIDTLVGFFGIDEKPTGSRDPFALRRAALGVIRLILENELRLGLGEIFGGAYARYRNVAWGKNASETVAELLDFLADRLKVHLRERGVRHDLIAAVFALGEDDLVRLTRRVAALDAFLKSEDGANLLTAYRRAANIVGIEQKRDGVTYDKPPDDNEFAMTEEIMLAKRLGEADRNSAAALAREDFAGAMAVLAGLRAPVDRFFDKVTVNDENRKLRENRLRLLARLRGVFDRVAAFSLIEG
jgi:glycyl-tRNA synthetase beta chain